MSVIKTLSDELTAHQIVYFFTLHYFIVSYGNYILLEYRNVKAHIFLSQLIDTFLEVLITVRDYLFVSSFNQKT